MKHFVFVLLCIISAQWVTAQREDTVNAKKLSYHFQLTAVNQSHSAFNAKYSGDNSMLNEAEKDKLSLTSTLFLGTPLWKNASLFLNPEISGGQGMSGAKGIAGFPNGETFRIGSTAPVLYVARFYFRQHFPIGNSKFILLEDDVNQVKEKVPEERITLHIGKFSLADYFDKNSISHDPRNQFLNWSLMSNGAWDYPADTRGYTKGIAVEYIKLNWALRMSAAMVPLRANGLQLDDQISKAHSETIELERKWVFHKMPGMIRLLAFHTNSQAPTYQSTITQVKNRDSSDVAVYSGQKTRGIYGGIKFGYALNMEQSISSNVASFFRASWNDGKTATWAFTEIDNSISGGLQLQGSIWNRSNDNIGIAQVVNGISKDHQAFLKAGLSGFMVGDGNLNYAPESITEIYYKARVTSSFYISADYQWVVNPGYNKDRGPIHVFGIRGHIEF
jgi:hypothetical protein